MSTRRQRCKEASRRHCALQLGLCVKCASIFRTPVNADQDSSNSNFQICRRRCTLRSTWASAIFAKLFVPVADLANGRGVCVCVCVCVCYVYMLTSLWHANVYHYLQESQRAVEQKKSAFESMSHSCGIIFEICSLWILSQLSCIIIYSVVGVQLPFRSLRDYRDVCMRIGTVILQTSLTKRLRKS